MTERVWHKASYSAASGNCVEVSEGSETLVRDTQNRELGYLSAQASEWTALLAAVRG
ncbi:MULTISPECIES: DUF397 domain-containing protein [Nocardiopsis]|jgi:hypothetical protein|uniref:DUF397 domain-containing protein n=1 Tax=Nocardiopsis dassonvillei (strain ATCC 23218 / DSM 43111 / CIP 107115 / JCM 7437 / KCTC 9190 / NBRC 14626 / NCTC 10488 / NRRL B-5397 / IMRU 509) TaxID=446468 RepID=D7AZR0_NOCDD|nr:MULTISPECIES: DUF397 domain-containing protein [Nocardiopsis]ADH68181.1 protein of unknown function DUF397 [Nocardiopsis dassonvillei subsp. dassonvillei DSM 43111]APC36296.1 DUF397 domain-containing protein [Nocardiopsis dassonvillei]NKY77173.1 DUF397 domain-containing protein [Nocardiopsis dassonvillei]VEI88684.1 Domain of uncharacterised function (DUF397) [Nocardiopsis dassonvillei]